MATEGQFDRAFLDNDHEQRFTISNVDVTGRVMKWAMVPLADDDSFDPATPTLQLTTTDDPGKFVTQSASSSQSVVDVLIDALDLVSSSIDPGRYHVQLEVFDAGGANGKVVATVELTLVANIQET